MVQWAGCHFLSHAGCLDIWEDGSRDGLFDRASLCGSLLISALAFDQEGALKRTSETAVSRVRVTWGVSCISRSACLFLPVFRAAEIALLFAAEGAAAVLSRTNLFALYLLFVSTLIVMTSTTKSHSSPFARLAVTVIPGLVSFSVW